MYKINQGHLTVFCIVFVWLGGPPSPVRIITQVPWFMYQNRLGPSRGIYYPNFVPCFVVLYLNSFSGCAQLRVASNFCCCCFPPCCSWEHIMMLGESVPVVRRQFEAIVRRSCKSVLYQAIISSHKTIWFDIRYATAFPVMFYEAASKRWTKCLLAICSVCIALKTESLFSLVCMCIGNWLWL